MVRINRCCIRSPFQRCSAMPNWKYALGLLGNVSSRAKRSISLASDNSNSYFLYDRAYRVHRARLGVGWLVFPELHLVLDIELLDHLIRQGHWVSLKRLGLGFLKT